MQASFAAKGDWRGLDAFLRQTEPESAAPRGHTNGHGPADDLTQLVGIGPKAATALTAGGLASYAALAQANEPEIRRALHDGDMVPPSSVSSWPMQASYAAKGDWQGLTKYNQKQAASRSTAPKAAKAAAAAVVTTTPTEPDDLTRMSGIGPRMEVLLNEGGVMTYDQLAHSKPEELRVIVARGGALPPASMSTWPAQAAFAAKDDWHGLEGYNKSR
jgi:predicted flap endonuclease-1-like 5' DNA nuclease